MRHRQRYNMYTFLGGGYGVRWVFGNEIALKTGIFQIKDQTLSLRPVCPDFFFKMREKMRQPKMSTFYSIFGCFRAGLFFENFDLFIF